MRTSFQIRVEKITNGYLYTQSIEDIESQKTFSPEKQNIYDLLKENELAEKLLNDFDEKSVFEIVKHDGNLTIEELKGQVVQKAEKFSPFKHQEVNEAQLRLSVNKINCYSAERLQAIDWVELDRKLPITMQRKAEITARKTGTLYATLKKAEAGECLFQSSDTRIYMTVLAKYYEAVTGLRSSKKDELEKLKAGIEEQIAALEILFKKDCLSHTNNLSPIIAELENLIGKETLVEY